MYLVVLSVRQYGPRDRLLLCTCASGSAQVTSTNKVLDGCLERCSCLLSCLLARCLVNEGARQSLLLAGDNACQVW